MSRGAPNPHKVVGTPHFCCLHVLEARISSQPDGHASCPWSGVGAQGCDFNYKCVQYHAMQAATHAYLSGMSGLYLAFTAMRRSCPSHTYVFDCNTSHLHDWGGIDADNRFLTVSF